MIAKRPIVAFVVAFAVASLLAGASSVASAQHAGHGMPMGGEIVIPKGAAYTKPDVEFMQGMIAHHAQAVVMSRMAEAPGRLLGGGAHHLLAPR